LTGTRAGGIRIPTHGLLTSDDVAVKQRPRRGTGAPGSQTIRRRCGGVSPAAIAADGRVAIRVLDRCPGRDAWASRCFLLVASPERPYDPEPTGAGLDDACWLSFPRWRFTPPCAAPTRSARSPCGRPSIAVVRIRTDVELEAPAARLEGLNRAHDELHAHIGVEGGRVDHQVVELWVQDVHVVELA